MTAGLDLQGNPVLEEDHNHSQPREQEIQSWAEGELVVLHNKERDRRSLELVAGKERERREVETAEEQVGRFD